MNSDALIAEELAEANACLARFDAAHSRAQSYFGFAVLTAVVSPLVWLVMWWLGSSKLHDLTTLTVVFPLGLLMLSMWWKLRAKRSFEEFKAVYLKMQRVGVYLRLQDRGILRRGLGVALPTKHDEDLAQISQRQLYAKLHAL